MPTFRDFVPWRFSDAGRHSPWMFWHSGVRKPAQKRTSALASARKPLQPYCCLVYTVSRRAPDGHARAGLQIQIRQTVGVGGARFACGHFYSGRSPRIGAKVCATKAPWYSGELGLSGTVSAGNAYLAIALEFGRSRLG